MTEKSDEKWFVLSIIMGALIATFYDVHQYWVSQLLHLLDPKDAPYQIVFTKVISGLLSALTGIGYYYFGFKKSRKKQKDNQNPDS